MCKRYSGLTVLRWAPLTLRKLISSSYWVRRTFKASLALLWLAAESYFAVAWPGAFLPERYVINSKRCVPCCVSTSWGKLYMACVFITELNHLVMYSQFRSKRSYLTGTYPTRERAVLESTDEAPPFDIPPLKLPPRPVWESVSLFAFCSIRIGLPCSYL